MPINLIFGPYFLPKFEPKLFFKNRASSSLFSTPLPLTSNEKAKKTYGCKYEIQWDEWTDGRTVTHTDTLTRPILKDKIDQERERGWPHPCYSGDPSSMMNFSGGSWVCTKLSVPLWQSKKTLTFLFTCSKLYTIRMYTQSRTTPPPTLSGTPVGIFLKAALTLGELLTRGLLLVDLARIWWHSPLSNKVRKNPHKLAGTLPIFDPIRSATCWLTNLFRFGFRGHVMPEIGFWSSVLSSKLLSLMS